MTPKTTDYPYTFRRNLASEDIFTVFAVTKSSPSLNLEPSLSRLETSLAQTGPSFIYCQAEMLRAINEVRRSARLKYLIPNKVMEQFKSHIRKTAHHERKYDEMVDREDRGARLEAAAKHIHD